MAQRALLIGSQTGGLTGVHADVALMGDVLESLGFATRRITAGEATRAAILAAHAELVAGTSAGDAALVFYSGHGGRVRPPAPGAGYVQYIVPTDADTADDGFGGILAEELSVMQAALTARTRNVVTVLDCCHAARMSRDPALLPKALPRPAVAWEGVRERLEAVRADPRAQALTGDANPDAVRIVAAAPEQSAYELDLPDGRRHGALTVTLATLLAGDASASLTWRQLAGLLRPAVMDLVPVQRPEVEGPADRLLFRLDARDAEGVLPIVVEDGVAQLAAPALFGVGEGDAYAVVAPGGSRAAPLGTAVVEAVAGARARLVLEGLAVADVPPGAEAHPLAVALGRRPVVVRPPGDPDAARVAERLRRSPHVRVADGGPALATVELGGGELMLLDALQAPLLAAPRPVGDGALVLLERDLSRLARAAHLRDLGSGTGSAALEADVAISYSRLGPDGAELPLEPSGEHLFAGDRIVVRLRNDAPEPRYVSLFDVGLAGAISHLSSSEPSGLTLAPGDVHQLYRTAAGLVGIPLFWPDGLPRSGPRPESLVTIVCDRRQDLSRLAQAGVARDGGERSALQRLLDEVVGGVRDAMPLEAEEEVVRFRVERLDFWLHASAREEGGGEPAFQLDERPDPSFRLIVPRGPGDAPSRVAVRLPELVVHSNRALLRAAVRVDALVITRPGEGGAPPYQAATARFDRVRDGDRLPFDNLLAYEGPVAGFLDLAVWVARDDRKGLDLAELLAAETGKEEVKGALTALAGLALAAPQAALAVASAAAVATIVATGARLLDAAVGDSIGIYRTSLLPHERFGVGRHPASGLLRSQDMSLAYEVVAQDD